MATNDFFISYRRKNVEFVQQFVSVLEARDKQIWIDWDDIPPGVEQFTAEIERGIEGAHIFVAVLSPDYMESEYCLGELEHAAQLNKRIIPIVHQKFESYPVPASIQAINWVYFTPHAGQDNPFESAFEQFIRASEADYAHIQEHTRLLQRALDWQSAGHNHAFLLRDRALNDAEQWLSVASEKQSPPASLHTAFILSSRQQQTRRQRRLLAGTSFLLLIALIALVIAVQQFLVADRRADETLSLLIANDALNALNTDDTETALNRIHHANTFLSNPPEAVQALLQRIAFQPAPRHIIEIPNNSARSLPAPIDTQLPISDGLYLQQDDETSLTLRGENDEVLIPFTIFRLESRDDTRIHPDVMNEIQTIQNNAFSPFGVGYDLSPDGERVVMGREGQGLIVWENRAGAPIYSTYTDHSFIVDNVQFSPDGQYLISKASEAQSVNLGRSEVEYFIWDTSRWQVIQAITQFDNSSELVGISDDVRQFIFLEYGSNRITIWDTNNPSLLWQVNTLDFVQDLAFNPDGTRVIASTVIALRMAPPNDIRLLDASTGAQITLYNGMDNQHIIGLPLLTGSDPDTVRIISDEGILNQLDVVTGDTTPIGTIDVSFISGMSDNGRYVATEDFDNSQLIIYDLQDAQQIASVPFDGFLRGVSIHPAGDYLAYTVEDPSDGTAQIIITDLRTAERVAQFSQVNATFASRAHLFSTDTFIYVDQDQTLHLIDRQTWQPIGQLRGFLEPITDIAYNPTAQRLAVAGENGAVMVWDSANGAIIFQLNGIGNRGIIALAPDGMAIATGNENGQISLWRLFSPADALTWMEDNRVISGLSCTDRVRYGLVACE
ncbi:MAG: toll/interleukin-1 receptor domain-containing protein [Anaerolineae bacterium]